MANLIRLKQIESGSQLSTAASVGEDFSGSVFEIIDGAGLVSSSAQIISILNPLNQHSASINEFTASLTSSLDTIFATDAELAISQSNISIDMGEF